MIPTGIMGLLVHATHLDEILCESPLWIGIGFLITAAFLWYGLKPRTRESTTTPLAQMTPRQTWGNGFIQGFASLPGISRSGSTIDKAVTVGVSRPAAAEF